MDDTSGLGVGVRREWVELPAELKAAVERAAGSAVLTATTCVGGFSPGIAAVLDLADGKRRFVKACASTPNPESPQMYRREIEVNSWLPEAVPAPRLLWHHDDGDWVVLLFDHVEGRTPQLPWRSDEVDQVLRAIADAHAALTPAPAGALAAADTHAEDFAAWRGAAAYPPAGLDEWSRRHLEVLAEHESRWADAITGDTLAHLDLRADNLLVDGTRAWLVDWPWAARAAGWADVVGMAPSVALQGGPDGAELLRRYPGTGPDDDRLAAFLAALAGYFTVGSLAPPPAGLPTVRAYQAAQGRMARAWLADLLDLR